MTEPRWLTKARQYNGLRETPGPGNSPAIMGWAAYLGGWVKSFYTGDSVPWCGLSAGALFKSLGYPIPKNPLSAREWADWGLALRGPTLGCVVVSARRDKAGKVVGHHVSLYLGERSKDGAYRVYGGNQGDAVGEMWLPRAQVIAHRWPAGEPLPVIAPVMLADDGKPVSTNAA